MERAGCLVATWGEVGVKWPLWQGNKRTLLPMNVNIQIWSFLEPLQISCLHLLIFSPSLVKNATHRLLCMSRIFVKIQGLDSWLDASQGTLSNSEEKVDLGLGLVVCRGTRTAPEQKVLEALQVSTGPFVPVPSAMRRAYPVQHLLLQPGCLSEKTHEPVFKP